MPPVRDHPDVEQKAEEEARRPEFYGTSLAQVKGLIRLLMNCKLSTYSHPFRSRLRT